MTTLPKLILASASPRRSEILTSVGWEFEKCAADVDESPLPEETPEDHVKRLALIKAEAVAQKYENALVLGADTIVVIDDEIIGKPKELDDARQMLRILSGKWHEVFTGVALVNKSEPAALAAGLNSTYSNDENAPPADAGGTDFVVDIQKTGVKFAELSEEEIEFLVRCGEPLDKAGAYAVQAQAALL